MTRTRSKATQQKEAKEAAKRNQRRREDYDRTEIESSDDETGALVATTSDSIVQERYFSYF